VPKSIFSDRYQVLLHHIVEARRTAGVTQQELAHRLRRPQSFISKTETGERRLDLIELFEITDALSIAPLIFIKTVLSDPAFRNVSR
jgi:transcriptional regulator with XRE-family HTH domain